MRRPRRFEGEGRWIAAGIEGIAPAPRAVTWWVRQFDQPAPKHLETDGNVIDGFDAESFFVHLLQALDVFPPKELFRIPSPPHCAPRNVSPAQELEDMLSGFSQQASKKVEALYKEVATSFSNARQAKDAFAWADEFERTAELSRRLRGAAHGGLSLLMESLARTGTPRVADGFLERAMRLRQRGRHSDHGDYVDVPSTAQLLSKRAKFRTGAAAERMYAEADRLMKSAKSGTPAGELPLRKTWAQILAD